MWYPLPEAAYEKLVFSTRRKVFQINFIILRTPGASSKPLPSSMQQGCRKIKTIFKSAAQQSGWSWLPQPSVWLRADSRYCFTIKYNERKVLIKFIEKKGLRTGQARCREKNQRGSFTVSRIQWEGVGDVPVYLELPRESEIIWLLSREVESKKL